jgi:HlyD family secretion protein
VLADVAQREAERRTNLAGRNLMSQEEAEGAQGASEARAASCRAARSNAVVARSSIEVARAEVAVHEAELQRTLIKAPFSGTVLRIVAEPGEFVGLEGVLELGRTERMFAIAEVYETDIRHVAMGQSARVESDALDAPLTGKVEFIRPMVHKQDEIGTDPAARKDAKVIEVGVLLDDPASVASLSNLQVEIVIGR